MPRDPLAISVSGERSLLWDQNQCRATAIREHALGPDHPDTGLSLNNLAGMLSDPRVP